MLHRRLASTLLALLACLLLLAACGSDDEGGSDSDSRDASGESSDSTGDTPPPATPEEAAKARTAGTASFSLSPAMSACMEQAGFTQDAPPTGGLIAWRHPSGARVVVGSGPDVTVGIASEIGTAEAPANVEGSIVIAADAKLATAANACLDS